MKLSPDIEQYILSHCDPEDEILKELDRETHFKVINYRMLAGHIQGYFLTILTKLIKPDRILEIGTLTGYSAICMARGLNPGGKLITIEMDDELERIAEILRQNKIPYETFVNAGFFDADLYAAIPPLIPRMTCLPCSMMGCFS